MCEFCCVHVHVCTSEHFDWEPRLCVYLIVTGKEMIVPGDNASMILTLGSEIPLELNQRFTLRDGVKTVGTGIITEIIA